MHRRVSLPILAVAIASLVALFSSGCPTPASTGSERASEPAHERSDEETIGVATMEADGTLVLQLRATGPGGTVGDAQLRYPRDHERYRQILDHVAR